MLSKKGFKMLRLINERKFDEIQDHDTLSFLESRGYVSTSGAGDSYVTPFGEEVYEDYIYHKKERFLTFLFNLAAIIISVIALFIAA